MRPCYCLILLLFLGSCLSVSKEQRTTVQQFAVNAANFSSLPEKLWMELADIRELRGIYYANSFTNSEIHLNELNDIVQERLHNDKVPDRIRPVFKILENYANGLVKLTSDASSTANSKLYGTFGTQLETLVGDYNQATEVGKLPSGVGTLLAETLGKGTDAYLSNRQLKALKKYVNQADTLVSSLCIEMEKYLSSELLVQLIDNEDTGLGESFRYYFTKRIPPSIESEMDYINLKKRIVQLKEFRRQAIAAVKKLRIAHLALEEALNKTKTVKEIAANLESFYADVAKLYTMVEELNKKSK
ncbi:MAG: hypothetical protein M0Q53_16180 [Prolixibacteraceae bacterium]|jgi:hypothetical protein|nr:hypothetical protein [Prolixibacteraceae bacterium]